MNTKLTYDSTLTGRASKFCIPYTGGYENDIPDVAVICAEGQEIIGCMTGYLSDNKGLVDKIAIVSDYRKKGIASSLLELFEKECRKKNCDIIETTVINGGMPALCMFYKYGFTKVLSRGFVESGISINDTELESIIKEFCQRKGCEAINSVGKEYIVTDFKEMGILLINNKVECASREFTSHKSPFKCLKSTGPKEIVVDFIKPEFMDLYERVLGLSQR